MIEMREKLKRRKFKHILQLLKKTDNVLELGAHVGFLSNLMAEEANAVVAIEPTPFIFNILKKDAAQNMDVYQYAVWGKDYEDTLALNTPNTIRYEKKGVVDAAQFNTFANKRGIGDATIDVVVQPFSVVVNKHSNCNVLVMDIETTEYEILMQNSDLVKKQFETISFEYHCVASVQKSLKFLNIYEEYKDMYKYFYLIPNYTIMPDKEPYFFQGTTVATFTNTEIEGEVNGVHRILEAAKQKNDWVVV